MPRLGASSASCKTLAAQCLMQTELHHHNCRYLLEVAAEC